MLTILLNSSFGVRCYICGLCGHWKDGTSLHLQRCEHNPKIVPVYQLRGPSKLTFRFPGCGIDWFWGTHLLPIPPGGKSKARKA